MSSPLGRALRVTLGAHDLGWTALVKRAGFTCARRIRLQAGGQAALDELLTELNELRSVSR